MAWKVSKWSFIHVDATRNYASDKKESKVDSQASRECREVWKAQRKIPSGLDRWKARPQSYSGGEAPNQKGCRPHDVGVRILSFWGASQSTYVRCPLPLGEGKSGIPLSARDEWCPCCLDDHPGRRLLRSRPVGWSNFQADPFTQLFLVWGLRDVRSYNGAWGQVNLL